MNSIIIGTSGHIDHGKTALIKALNGYEGDKTSDEIKRGITIDLSFCYKFDKKRIRQVSKYRANTAYKRNWSYNTYQPWQESYQRRFN